MVRYIAGEGGRHVGSNKRLERGACPYLMGGGGRGYWSSLENCRKIVLHLTRKIEKIINIQEIDNG